MTCEGKISKSLNLSKGDTEYFNEYFANICSRLSQSKPICMENNVIRRQQSLFLKKKIDLSEVIDVIETLKNEYNTDCYDINTVFVKHLKTIPAGPLSEILMTA